MVRVQFPIPYDAPNMFEVERIDADRDSHFDHNRQRGELGAEGVSLGL